MVEKFGVRRLNVWLDADSSEVAKELKLKGYTVNAVIRRLLKEFGKEEGILPTDKPKEKRRVKITE